MEVTLLAAASATSAFAATVKATVRGMPRASRAVVAEEAAELHGPLAEAASGRSDGAYAAARLAESPRVGRRVRVPWRSRRVEQRAATPTKRRPAGRSTERSPSWPPASGSYRGRSPRPAMAWGEDVGRAQARRRQATLSADVSPRCCSIEAAPRQYGAALHEDSSVSACALARRPLAAVLAAVLAATFGPCARLQTRRR